MRYSYDAEADALTIYVLPGQHSARTIEIDESRFVDLNESGQVIAVEVLWASHGFDLLDIVDRYEDLWPFAIDFKEIQATPFRSAQAL